MDAVHNDPTKYPFCWYERDKRVYERRMEQRKYVRELQRTISKIEQGQNHL